jgi:SAM-dependent methyltransferase
MGCGTGRFTARLRIRFPSARLLATDASPGMLAEARKLVPGADFALLDARGADPASCAAERESRDLAASNALVQWFPDLDAHFRFVGGRLRPGGAYLVSGFRADNFPELNAILRGEPFGYRDFPGHSLAEVEAAAGTAGLRAEALAGAEERGTYPDARAFLAHIQGLGSARRPAEGRPLTRGRLALLLERYQEGYPDGEGVAATWRTWTALLRRPA